MGGENRRPEEGRAMGRGLWKEALGRTWRDKWEETLAILGGITTVLAGGLPVWMRLMWLGVSGLLLLRVLSAFRRTVLLLKEKHVPLVVLVGRDLDTARAMWGDVQRVMARWGFDEERYRREFDVEREDVFLHHAAPFPRIGRTSGWGWFGIFGVVSRG